MTADSIKCCSKEIADVAADLLLLLLLLLVLLAIIATATGHLTSAFPLALDNENATTKTEIASKNSSAKPQTMASYFWPQQVAHTPRWPVSPLARWHCLLSPSSPSHSPSLLIFLSLAACCTCTFFLHYGVWKNFRFSRI